MDQGFRVLGSGNLSTSAYVLMCPELRVCRTRLGGLDVSKSNSLSLTGRSAGTPFESFDGGGQLVTAEVDVCYVSGCVGERCCGLAASESFFLLGQVETGGNSRS